MRSASSLLLMSGLRIFNYHPSLYWGNYGYRGVPSFISISAIEDSETDELTGITRIGPWRFETTGVLGVSADADGDPAAMAFPNWITLPGGPGLALARDWHFALAWLLVVNGAVYLLFGLLVRPLPQRHRAGRRGACARATCCARSGTTSGCAGRGATPRGATTCSKSSPISS